MNPKRSGSVPLAGLFGLALLLSIHVARPVLLPIVLAILLSVLLEPVVSVFDRIHAPRPLGAGLTVAVLVASTVWGVVTLAGPASEWLTDAPDRLREVQTEIESLRRPVERVSKAAEQVGEITRGGGSDSPKVTVEEDAPLQVLMRGATEVGTTIVLTLALVFFFLASGRLFLLKLIRVLPGYAARKRALKVAASVRRNLSTHLLTVTAINAVLGLAVGLSLALVGLPNPVLWGVMAGVLNFVPYLGAMFGIGVVGIVAITTVDGLGSALIAPLTYLLLTGVEGTLITPAILGARLRLNPVAVFVGVLLWGFLWGVPGALLAVPILTSLKVVTDAYPRLAPFGEFLGR